MRDSSRADAGATLIRQLVALRLKRGLTQRQLAERTGMKQPIISRIESRRAASLKSIQRMADALDAELQVTVVPRESRSKNQGDQDGNSLAGHQPRR